MTGEPSSLVLTQEQAARVAILLASGVLDCVNGKATVNFHEGHVQSIQLEERRYQHVPLARPAGGA